MIGARTGVMQGAQRARTHQRALNYLARNWPLYAMISPALIVLALFHYYPMYGLVIAFQDFNPGLGFAGSPWVGLQNFELLLVLPDFGQVFWNTLVIAVAKIVSVQVVAVIFALMLNEIRSTFFKRTIQTFVYLPHFLSWIVLGGILFDILSAQGMVNQGLGMLGLKPILFLGSNTWFQPTLVISNLWKEAGWAAIIYLAGLTGIDPSLYEAAAIDGADRWHQMLHVTVPGILSLVILIACLDLGNVLNAGFEQILTLYNPAVYATGDILDTWVYRQGLISAQYSLAAAVGLVKSALSFVLILIAYWLAMKVSDYRIF
ncbi:MAG TPA: ABC transporter permease subunit [Chloroflexota bacterium]|nr:ABC transporter permease subunit [Chloroflexota bacterium]